MISGLTFNFSSLILHSFKRFSVNYNTRMSLIMDKIITSLFNVHVMVCTIIWSWSKLSFDKYSSIGTSHTKNKIWQRYKVINVRTGEMPSTFSYWCVLCVKSFVCVCVFGWLVWVFALLQLCQAYLLILAWSLSFLHLNLNSSQYWIDYKKIY